MFVWKGKLISYDGHTWIVNEVLGDRVTLIRSVSGMPFEREVSIRQLESAGSWTRRGWAG